MSYANNSKFRKVFLCVVVYAVASLMFVSIYVHRDLLPNAIPDNASLTISISVWMLALIGSFFATNGLRCERSDPNSDRVAVRFAFIAYVLCALYYFT